MGTIMVTLPDRREVGRFASGAEGWAVQAFDGRPLGTATAAGVTDGQGRRLSSVAPDGHGGWRSTVEGGPHTEPVGALVVGAAAAADVLAAS